MTWTKIDGWLSRAEGEILRAFAVGADVLEIGSYKGRSTVCMAGVARRVTAIDWCQGDDDAGWESTEAELRSNLHAAGVGEVVELVVSRIEDLPTPHPSRDLVFIDAAHDADCVRACTAHAALAVRPGGVIAWHDCDRPDVIATIQGMGFTLTGIQGSLGWAKV